MNTSTDPQMIKTPTHVYLLQVEPNANPSLHETQVLPLHLLSNTLEYGQYLLPIMPAKQIENLNKPGNVIGAQQKSLAVVDLDPSQLIQNQYLTIPNNTPTQAHCTYLDCQTKEIVPNQRPDPSDLPTNGSSNIDKCEEKQKLVQNYVHISDRSVPPRAVAVLPAVLQIRAGNVISPRRTLPARARFGPLLGIKTKVSQTEVHDLIKRALLNKTPLFLIKDDSDNFIHIDVADKDKSNWIGLLPLGDQKTSNIWLYEENHELYAITTDAIACRKPLMLGYSRKYAEDYGLMGQPTKDILDVPKVSKPWWCYECQRAMPSASLLQRHMDVYHKEGKPQCRRRRYRCRQCTLSFARLFTLRRHVLRYCTKKPTDSVELTNAETLLDISNPIGLTSITNTDDNRIPSDESFQNYSTGLDFSTNLFDTDRIPNLDISGNSRSEGEFNPYGYKDDNALPSDLGFGNTCSNGNEIPQTYTENLKKKEKNVDPILVTCPYCNQVVMKEKKRQHVSECTARRFACECGKVFTNKTLLADHIYITHPIKATTKPVPDKEKNDTKTSPSENTSYKCEKCEQAFKRRGMLVNHMWRVHKCVSVSVPLRQAVRHYPCVACPKLYRTAAKRDHHVLKHHPGSEKIQTQPIEGGVRTCEPAACPACPRQYSTRAKLLQHQRARHPYLAPPPKVKLLKTKSSSMQNNQITTSVEPIKYISSYEQMF